MVACIGIFLCLQVPAQKPSDRDPAIYNAAEARYPGALAYAKRNFERVKDRCCEDTAYISAASRLGGVYYSMVRFDSAHLYAVKACEGAMKQYGANSVQYASFLVTVATTQMELGQYQEAEQGFQQATAILTRVDSSYDREAYTRCLTQHAGFYITTGSLNKAEELCVTACEIARGEPADTTAYVAALDKMSWLYEKLGFYSKQEVILSRMFEIQRRIYGGRDPRYANAIAAQAAICQRNGKLEKADSMYRKALEIKEQVFGKGSAANISILNHIGIVKMERGKYRLAENYLREAVEIVCQNMGGEESALYPYCAKNLARLYVLSGRKELAEPLFQKCLAVYNRMGLTFNTGRLNVLHEMAELLYAGDPAKAAVYLQQGVETEDIQLLNKLDFLSETELLAYSKRIKEVAESPYRFLLHYKSPAIAGAAYNSRLLVSGIGLQNTRTLYQNMARSSDSAFTGCWKNYLQQKSSYVNLLLTPAAQRKVNTDSIAGVLNRQEKDLLRRSADYRNMKERLAVTWQDVQKHLKPNETAIEFIRFNAVCNIHPNAKSAMVYYAALLLRPRDTAPQFVTLCGEKQLTNVIKKFPYKAAISSRGEKPAGCGPGITNALYELVWKPLAPYLTHVRTVYYSPDGLLHRVAFAAISYKKDHLLCDKYDFVQLISTRQIALRETRPAALISIAMFGGINYNRQSADSGSRFLAYQSQPSRGAGLDSFRFLPHSLTEINSIKADAEAVRKRFAVFTGDNATEAAFRNLEGENSPEVIHFATHGFTLPDTSGPVGNAGASFRTSDNPLLHCGLVMAGGNKGWKGHAGLNEDDGILTGLEISSIQLPNTQLAVLSACETGLGKIEGSEGVFGLQRAFKLAGVNYVMASLWQVPDKETAEFMEIFYARWLGGQSIRQAFLGAQQIMRKKYAPYYWAGFTLVQ